MKRVTYLGCRLRQIRTLCQRTGFLKTFRTVAVEGVFKRIRSAIGYFSPAARCYGEKIIFIAGMPRSGSTWISRMLGSIAGYCDFSPVRWHQKVEVGEQFEHALYPGVFNEFRFKLAVVKGHSWGTKENVGELRATGARYFVTVRDPRDALISEYWYVRKMPFHVDHKITMENDVHGYIRLKLSDGSFNAKTLAWVRGWLSNRDTDRSMVLRYCDLIADQEKALGEAFGFVGIDVSDERLKEIIAEHRFERASHGRLPGMEDTSSIVRRGLPGEWKSVFTDEEKRQFAEVGEDVVTALRYAPTLLSGICAGVFL